MLISYYILQFMSVKIHFQTDLYQKTQFTDTEKMKIKVSTKIGTTSVSSTYSCQYKK